MYRRVVDFASSVVFNYSYLPFSQARLLPIWVNRLHFSKYAKYCGKIVIESDTIYPRMIRLGVDFNYWYPEEGIKLFVHGTIIFKGKCLIGNNSTIYVKNGGTLIIGDGVSLSANNSILCENSITIDNNTKIAWGCQIMDTDFHYMHNVKSGECTLTKSKPIYIGQNNWIGKNCEIFKGFITCDYVTVGGGSKCLGQIVEPYTVWSSGGKMEKLKDGWCIDRTKDPDLFSKLL